MVKVTEKEIGKELLINTHQSLKGRAYTRFMRYTHIKRKMALDSSWSCGRWYKFNGQYSKGKIHCSCPMCSAKTRKNGHKISEIRKLIEAN